MTATGSGVAVIGAGSWGTTLAIQIARGAGAVRLWGRDASLVSTMQATRENPRYLPGIALSAGVRATTDHAEALRGADLVLVAVPSHFVRATLGPMVRAVPPGAAVLSATKGFEPGTALRMSELLAELLPEHPVAALSGPSFAREVAGGKPAALVVASPDPAVARQLQERLTAPAFRLYTNRDLVGVEIGGALKNVMAIATGLSDGLGLGENARAALVTRGLAEIGRLALASGGQAATLAGLAGLGDLVLTCTGTLSRNRHVGVELARGRPLAEVVAGMKMVAEGVRTTGAALALGERCGVELPITEQMAEVLSGRTDVRTAVGALMVRRQRAEPEPVGPGGHPK